MLLNISRKPHSYLPINGLHVSEVNEYIAGKLEFISPPNYISIDHAAYDIAEYVDMIFKRKEKEKEEYQKSLAEWKEQFDALPEEKRKKFEEENYLEGFPQRPVPPEYYDGVLIGEDVPVFLVGLLLGYLARYHIPVHFDFLKEEYVEAGAVPTDIPGVYENKRKPSGNKTHMIFLYRDDPTYRKN